MIYKRNIHVRITYPITNIISYSPTREYIYICVCVCVCVRERERERERELVFVREWDHQLCFLSQALPILRKLDMTITSKRSVSWVHFA
jgi:hypothetical protein